MDRGLDLFLIIWLIAMILVWPPWIWMSVHGRMERGEPVIPRKPVNATFCERKASGRARGNILGQASRCLMVAVTGPELWITPTFPFNMIAPYGLLGLEHRVARKQVAVVETRESMFGSTVVLKIPQRNAEPRIVDLRLKDTKAFLAALRA